MRVVVILFYLLHYVHSYCMVEPDMNGHVSAAALSTALAQTSTPTIIGVHTSADDYQNSGFNRCYTLKSIKIPASVTEIGYDAFYSALALTSVDFSLATSLETIGDFAFQKTNLESVTIPDSVTEIRKYAFSMTMLTSVTIPSQVTTLSEAVFYDSTKLTSVDLSQVISLETIGKYAFQRTGLESVVIPENVTTIDDYAFSMTMLTSVTIPSQVTEIGKSSFWQCTKLTSVDLSGATALETIGVQAFKNSGLTSLTIPTSVKTIDDYAFHATTALTSINFSGATSLTTIGEYAFKESGLTAVDLSGATSLITIGSSAFREAKALTSVILPSSVKTIDNYAFSSATALTSVNLDHVTSIGTYAFYNTCLLSEPSHGAGSNVGYSAFSAICFTKCRLDESPPGMNLTTGHGTYDKTHGFYGCKYLTSVTISDSVDEIGASAFKASGLTSVTIPSSVEKIDEYAFSQCTALTSIDFSQANHLRDIEHEAFAGSTALTSLTFPDGLTNIHQEAFFGCTALTSVTIPESVRHIGAVAFPTKVFILDVFTREDTSVSTILTHFSLGELQNAYQKQAYAAGICPSRL